MIHRELQIETPYLPDAASGGIALRAQPGHTLPGVTGEMVLGPSCVIRWAPNQELVILVAHRGDWPKSEGFRLILAERRAGRSVTLDITSDRRDLPRGLALSAYRIVQEALTNVRRHAGERLSVERDVA